jgi:hypothetical protein
LNIVFYDIFYDIVVAEKRDADLTRRHLKQRFALAGVFAGFGYPFNPARKYYITSTQQGKRLRT